MAGYPSPIPDYEWDDVPGYEDRHSKRESPVSFAGFTFISGDDWSWLIEKAELALVLDHFCTTGEDRDRLNRIKEAYEEASSSTQDDR